MKHYLLSIEQPDGPPPEPEVFEPIIRAVQAFNDELKTAGAWVFAGGLHAAGDARVLRAEGGDVLITDGPYIESKEHLGGICIVRADDLDEALEWGRRLARATTLPVEVREFLGDATGHLT